MFAYILNILWSGKLFIKLAQTIRTITRSDAAVTAIFVLGSFLWYALIFIFFKNMLAAVVRRIFLQARIYKHVSFLDVTHIAAVRKWLQASWTMLLKYIYFTLWTFIVVGGAIKYYSYWAVPYIVAENPSIKGRQAVTLSRKMMNVFIAFAFTGWSWEVALHFMQTGQFANRGTLHGPWLPIYGTGGIIVLILCSKFRKNPVAEFFTAVLLSGILEYTSAWHLETKYHQRWWSYDGYFLNLHGRICAEGLLVFGVGCCAIVYLFAPMFDYLVSKIRQKVLIGISLALALIYGIDLFYSGEHPNMAEGAVEAPVETETEGASEEPEEALTGEALSEETSPA